MNKFLNNDHVIHTSSPKHKSILEGWDELVKERSKSSDNYLSDNFVSGVAKAYRKIVAYSLKALTFRNEDK